MNRIPFTLDSIIINVPFPPFNGFTTWVIAGHECPHSRIKGNYASTFFFFNHQKFRTLVIGLNFQWFRDTYSIFSGICSLDLIPMRKENSPYFLPQSLDGMTIDCNLSFLDLKFNLTTFASPPN